MLTAISSYSQRHNAGNRVQVPFGGRQDQELIPLYKRPQAYQNRKTDSIDWHKANVSIGILQQDNRWQALRRWIPFVKKPASHVLVVHPDSIPLTATKKTFKRQGSNHFRMLDARCQAVAALNTIQLPTLAFAFRQLCGHSWLSALGEGLTAVAAFDLFLMFGQQLAHRMNRPVVQRTHEDESSVGFDRSE